MTTATAFTQIPGDTDPKTPPGDATAGLEQVGSWFFWLAIASLALIGVAAGIYLAVSYQRTGQLTEGERRVALLAVGTLIAATSGGWAAVLL